MRNWEYGIIIGLRTDMTMGVCGGRGRQVVGVRGDEKRWGLQLVMMMIIMSVMPRLNEFVYTTMLLYQMYKQQS